MNTTAEAEVNPGKIHALITGYLQSKALFMAVELDLFTKLSSQSYTEENISNVLNLKPRATRILLNSCMGIGLIEKKESFFYNTALSDRFLVKGKNGYMGELALHQNQHFKNFISLTDSLKNNESITKRVRKDGYSNEGATESGEESDVESFIKAMHGSSIVQAKALADVCKVDSGHMVDFGCGSGAYSIAFAKKNPNIRITAIDYPKVCSVAEGFVREENLQEKIKFSPGNLFEESLPNDLNTILLSHVLDGYGEEKAFELLSRVSESLPPGGQLILHTHLAEKAETPFPYLFNLILLANTEEGEVHREETLYLWLKKLGFGNIKNQKVSPISSVIIAKKP